MKSYKIMIGILCLHGMAMQGSEQIVPNPSNPDENAELMVEDETVSSDPLFSDNVDEIKKAVAQGIDINSMQSEPALILAAFEEDLLDESWTPLMAHAYYGNYDLVNYLVEHGANVDAQSEPSQFNALMFSINNEGVSKKESLRIVQLLLDHGAKPSDHDAQGHNAFWHARNAGRPDIVALMKNDQEKRAAAHAATALTASSSSAAAPGTAGSGIGIGRLKSLRLINYNIRTALFLPVHHPMKCLQCHCALYEIVLQQRSSHRHFGVQIEQHFWSVNRQ